MNHPPRRVLCAMSGGVDSSVAAWLLKEAGFEVVGAYLRLGPEAGLRVGSRRTCASIEDSRDAALVASRLDIPFYVMNYQDEFARVIDYFVEEYRRGRTPNPCVRCNEWIKLGSLRRRAAALGCTAIATGHYARIEPGSDGRHRLLRGRDRAKDQSYFLFLLEPEALPATLFPCGGFEKDEVRALARSARLPVAEKVESQEVCFVPDDDYRAVLRERSGGRLRAGKLLTTNGETVGEHPGIEHFTIGQRRGLGVALGAPRYVVSIDALANTVTLGSREDLRRREVRLEALHWTSLPPPAPGSSLRLEAQIRYRQAAKPASLELEEGGGALLRFDEPIEAVSPGQAAVFYDGDLLLGGGWIV
jgi:tRNA-specific 2-thiouridylase